MVGWGGGGGGEWISAFKKKDGRKIDK